MAHAEELAVVLDEVGSERAAILDQVETTPTAILFARIRLERVVTSRTVRDSSSAPTSRWKIGESMP
jgi:predicted ATPase